MGLQHPKFAEPMSAAWQTPQRAVRPYRWRRGCRRVPPGPVRAFLQVCYGCQHLSHTKGGEEGLQHPNVGWAHLRQPGKHCRQQAVRQLAPALPPGSSWVCGRTLQVCTGLLGCGLLTNG